MEITSNVVAFSKNINFKAFLSTKGMAITNRGNTSLFLRKNPITSLFLRKNSILKVAKSHRLFSISWNL